MPKAKLKKPWTVWITGLSGSGNTTISKELFKNLNEYFRLDEIRRFLTPDPMFSKGEMEYVYRSTIFAARLLTNYGINIIIDSVDGRGAGRNLGKKLISIFWVVWIDCPLGICIQREEYHMDKAEIIDLYQKALQGQLSLPGIGYDCCHEKNRF